MIYIVSGYVRTGTSMMMQALHAGGMDVVYSEERESFISSVNKDEFYIPNPRFYEISPYEYNEPNFPLKYEGKLIKVMQWGLLRMVPYAYKIVLMKRDAEEIRQSHEAFLGHYPPKNFIDTYEKNTLDLYNTLQQRDDVNIVLLNYKDVVFKPIDAFKLLKNNEWPINDIEAAKVVNSELYRFRHENLIEGLTCTN